MLRVFFTGVYFLVFLFLIDSVFRNLGTTLPANLLAILCWVIALFVSAGLGDFTVRKIQEKNQRK